MPLSSSVWLVIAADEAVSNFTNAVDAGDLAEARKIQSHLNALCEKLSQDMQSRGALLYICSWERSVAEIPDSLAEELPQFLKPYNDALKGSIAVGLGITFHEATIAAGQSAMTRQIEFYEEHMEHEMAKSEDFTIDDDLQLPPNLYDPHTPPPRKKGQEKIEPAFMSFDEHVQAESALVQSVIQTMGGGQQQQMQQQAQAQEQEPGNLLEALNGGPIPGQEQAPQQEQQPQQAPQEQQAAPAEEDKSHEKMASMLSHLKDQLPQIMEMADKNPDAFKQTMNLVNKLLTFSKQKAVSKTGNGILAEKIAKAIKLRFPVGTVRNRKKKVIVNGKAVWRSVISGQVKDAQGNPVSIKSHNNKADGD